MKIIPELSDKDLIRYWSKVDIKGEDECWEWESKIHKDYGVFTINMMKKAHEFGAHRISLFIKTGIQGEQARHICDNPVCVNPKHLLWGSNRDNVNDRMVRNRQLKGSTHGRAKITESDVLFIRESFNNGDYTKNQLAEIHHMTTPNIHNIINRVIWKHI